MNLTDILLIVLIVLLLLLFVAVPVGNYFTRMRKQRQGEAKHKPGTGMSTRPQEDMPVETENNGHDYAGGARVEEPAAALESDYRRVDPAQDLPSPQSAPGKKNGKPH